jgi:hypothetical protein
MYVNIVANNGSDKLWTKNTSTLNMYNLDSEIQNYVAWWLEDRRRIEDKQKQQKHFCYTALWSGDIGRPRKRWKDESKKRSYAVNKW